MIILWLWSFNTFSNSYTRFNLCDCKYYIVQLEMGEAIGKCGWLGMGYERENEVI